MSSHDESVPLPIEEARLKHGGPFETVLPDCMAFRDLAGDEHRIFLDLGTHETAYQLFVDENWDELKKFPKHIGQKHAKPAAAERVDISKEKKQPEAEG